MAPGISRDSQWRGCASSDGASSGSASSESRGAPSASLVSSLSDAQLQLRGPRKESREPEAHVDSGLVAGIKSPGVELTALLDTESALRRLRLDKCRDCLLRSLPCNKARPSCWNCEQYYQECCYAHDKVGIAPLEQRPVRKTREIHDAETDLDGMSWKDAMKDQPYCNVDGSRKLDLVGALFQKTQRQSSRKTMRRNLLERTDVIYDAEDDEEALLGETRSRGSIGARHQSWGSAPSSLGSSQRTPKDNAGQDNVEDPPLRPGQQDALQYLKSGPWTFQCVFCLKSCGSSQEWELHERSHWLAHKDWICMPWDNTAKADDGSKVCAFCGAVKPDDAHLERHDLDSCFSREVKERTFRNEEDFREHLLAAHDQLVITEHMESWSFPPLDNAWYWHCGFCDVLLARWTDRVAHISEHFKEGRDMTSWDPLTPPYPFDKETGSYAAWFAPNCWGAETSLVLQLGHCIVSRTADASEQQSCLECDVSFPSGDVTEHHMKIWHSLRNVWSCPTKDDLWADVFSSGPFARFLFANTAEGEDICPYCGEYYEKLFCERDDDGDDDKSHDSDIADWSGRVRHLEDMHGFGSCRCQFYRQDQFVLHLAGWHGLRLEGWTHDVIESCRRVKQTLAAITDDAIRYD